MNITIVKMYSNIVYILLTGKIILVAFYYLFVLSL